MLDYHFYMNSQFIIIYVDNCIKSCDFLHGPNFFFFFFFGWWWQFCYAVVYNMVIKIGTVKKLKNDLFSY